MEKPHLLRAVAAMGLVASPGCAMTARIAKPPAMLKDTDEARGGPGPFSYSAGRGVQDFAAPSGALTSAVAEAMNDLNISVTKRGHEGTVTQVDGRTFDDRAVRITIRPRFASLRV